jgi:hypothetical protein
MSFRCRFFAVLPAVLLCAAAGAAVAYHREDFGNTVLEVSTNQDDARAVRYYQLWTENDWLLCSDEVAISGVVTAVNFEFPKEVSSFTLHLAEGDIEIDVDREDLPQSRKWILSTLIKRGARLKTVSRGCGSASVPYLISVSRAGT